MVIREIGINTSTLQSDVETLEQQTNLLERKIEDMFNSVKALQSTWEGPAHTAFEQQFGTDYRTSMYMVKTLRELIASLKNAREKYDECASEVDGLVNSLRV